MGTQTAGPHKADALVLFGITGDLAEKMLLPALYELARRGELTARVVGVTRGGWTLRRLREHARSAVTAQGPVDEAAFARFAALLRLATVDYEDPGSFRSVAEETRGCAWLSHYLAVPPAQYVQAAEGLAAAGLNSDAWLVVEKPFGHDLASARALQQDLTRHFPEYRLRRVDHFLGKNVVENLLTFRRANPLLDAVLDHKHTRGIQITMAESFDVADRGGFYDATGCLRDVVQNHLLQLLAHLLMEAPRTASAEDSLDERTRVLEAVRTVRPQDYVRGQYDGYLDVDGVRADSVTETFTALRLWAETDRWAGVPIVIRAGKTMPVTAIEIVLELRSPADDPRPFDGAETPAPNLVRYRVSPRSGVTFSLVVQNGDAPAALTQTEAAADFTGLTGDDTEAYQHVLAHALTGDPRQFTRMDMVEECWRIVGDILDPSTAPVPYRPGTWGPRAADQLTTDGSWHPLGVASGS
ncbi:glucose-6-phosphate dehydrogenase [Streptomyces sp. NPDC049954]|uniref:glucose-6-phosphate dehydrogenase n=1 Tax=Streptomyces sp. NPDC049954 TaxID=3155779 RepID=UPI00341F11F8